MSAISPTVVRLGPKARVPAAVATVGRAILETTPVVASLALWGLSLGSIHLSRISDFGLLPALPWAFYVSLAVLTAGFAVAIGHSRPQEWVLSLYVASLIVIVHGTPAISYGTLRYAWAWKHVGIVDYILRHGRVDPSIQFLTAYHNWPGFFAVAALYTHLSGFASALSFASWAPVFFNLIFFGALVVLFRALSTDRRRVWLAVWIFFSANWIGQDYFSPQAFTYFLFLVVVAICLTWFRLAQTPGTATVRRYLRRRGLSRWVARFLARADADAAGITDAGGFERAGLILLVIAFSVVISSSHQLTPFMLVLGLSGLVVFQRITLRSLPLLEAVVATAWVTLFAVGFLRGNLYWVVDSFGTATSNAGSTLINLSHASFGEQVVAKVDRALTLSVWALGVLGFLRLARRGRLELSAGLLALAPFAMLGVTSYGGEILFRVYFFALPFFALLAAGLFFPTPRKGWRTAAALRAVVCGLLVIGLLFSYYGNERQNYFSPATVRAAEFLYRTAPTGSLLVDGVSDYPWAFAHYEDYSYLSLSDLPTATHSTHPLRTLLAVIHRPGGTIAKIARRDEFPCAYVILTRSQAADVDMTGLMPYGAIDDIGRRLTASPQFRVILRNPDATVFGMAVTDSATACHLERVR